MEQWSIGTRDDQNQGNFASTQSHTWNNPRGCQMVWQKLDRKRGWLCCPRRGSDQRSSEEILGTLGQEDAN